VTAAFQIAAFKNEGETMAIQRTLGNLWFHPETKHEANILALKVFCLGSFILIALIMAGVL
jgi:hypothetical protein